MGDAEREAMARTLERVGSAFFWTAFVSLSVMGKPLLSPIVGGVLLYRLVRLSGSLPSGSRGQQLLVGSVVLGTVVWAFTVALWFPGAPDAALRVAGSLAMVAGVAVYAEAMRAWCLANGWQRIARAWRRGPLTIATTTGAASIAAALAWTDRSAALFWLAMLVAAGCWIVALFRLSQASASVRSALRHGVPHPVDA